MRRKGLILAWADRFWVVTDPTPESTLEDICSFSSLVELGLQFRGGLSPTSHIALYADRDSAEADARVRLENFAKLIRHAAKCSEGR